MSGKWPEYIGEIYSRGYCNDCIYNTDVVWTPEYEFEPKCEQNILVLVGVKVNTNRKIITANMPIEYCDKRVKPNQRKRFK